MRRLTAWGMTIVACVAALPSADAYSVQPMIYRLTPSGTGSTARITVANTHDSLLNIELQPFSVTADIAGKRSFTPAPGDFLIFPPQASIQPDKAQLMQVRYVGPAALSQGRVYVLRVHQTNTVSLIKEDPKTSLPTKLNVAIHFNTIAIVEPHSLAADLVVAHDLAPDPAGVLHGQLVNRGKGVADLSQVKWALDRGGKVTDLASEQILYGEAVFIEPGASRDVSLAPTIKGSARLVLARPGGSDGRARP